MQIKNFSIFKVKEKKFENGPDYTISINVGTQEEPKYVDCGGCWVKEGKAGKFFSCKLSDKYVDHTTQKRRDGFHIAIDETTDLAKSYTPDADEPNLTVEDLPF